MNKFTLELLCNIIGIGSASGLLYKDQTLHLISDNSTFLYQYHMPDQSLSHHALAPKPAANIPKPQKPDFESMVSDAEKIYVFGSGSTQNRNTLVTLDKISHQIIAITDLTNLYLSMQSFAQIPPDGFNIEGVARDQNTWYFFQRGNGAGGQNGVFTVEARDFELDFNMVYNAFKLPKIGGVRASFTDAVAVGGKLYFLATSEDTKSTYHDGQILGSMIGIIDIAKMKLGKTQVISTRNKFEGLAVYASARDSIAFLLCEDNDTNALESAIYLLRINH